jgi:hypothetical protein
MHLESPQQENIHPLKNKAQARRMMIKERQKNSTLWQLIHLLGSLQLALILLATIAIACGVATFTESHFDTKVAHAMIYKAPWFLAWLGFLCLNLFAVTLTRWPWERKHLGFVITHYGIITLLMGAAIGSKLGFEGNVTLQVHGAAVKNITTNQSVLEMETPLNYHLYLLPFDATLARPSKNHPTRLRIPETKLHLVIDDWSDSLEEFPELVRRANKDKSEAVLLRLSSQALHQEHLVALSLEEKNEDFFDFFGLATITLMRSDKPLQPPAKEATSPAPLTPPPTAPEEGSKLSALSPTGTKKIPLTRIFHTDRDEEAAKADGVRRVMKSDDGCMSTYRPSHNVSLTQDPSDFPVSAVDRRKISGLIPSATHKPWLALALEPNSDRVEFLLGRHNKTKKSGSLLTGEVVPLGWADWQMELLQSGHHEHIVSRTRPTPPSSKKNNLTGTPGFHAFLEDPDGLKSEATWVSSGQITPLILKNIPIRIGYGLELRPIPFSIELVDFQIPRDEGTETPGDFRATVCFHDRTRGKTDTIRHDIIRMNHPASFPGGFLANVTGINYKFSQAEWNPQNLEETTLQVLYDPGWLLKWIGSLAICIGIAMMFYWKENKGNRLNA